MNKFTRLFIDESRVYIPGLAAIIQRLIDGRPEELDLHEGRRLSHSVKGMALFEQQTDIAVLTRAMERAFERLLASRAQGTLLVDLGSAVSVLARLIDEVEEHGAPRSESGDIVAALEAASLT